jgi:hypothetical protein
MGKKEVKGSRQEEIHSYWELCENLFQMRLEIAVYAQRPITQADIDGLPQLVRLANEKKIKELGFKLHINPVFRFQAKMNKSLETQMEEGLYYRALEGGVAVDIFKRN